MDATGTIYMLEINPNCGIFYPPTDPGSADFSLMNDAVKPAVPAGVTLTAAEIGQNTVGGLGTQFIRIPQRLMNPTTSKLVQLYFPAVSTSAPINARNGRLTDYFYTMSGTIRRDLGTMRVDHDFRDKDRFYAVYNAQSTNFATAAAANPFLPLGLTQNQRSNQTFSVSETHLFSPRVVNEIRGGFNRVPSLRRSNGTLRQFLQSIGFNPAMFSRRAMRSERTVCSAPVSRTRSPKRRRSG